MENGPAFVKTRATVVEHRGFSALDSWWPVHGKGILIHGKTFFEFFKTKKHVDKCIPPRLVKYHFKPFSMTKPKGAFPKTNITKKKFILQFILVTLSQKPRIQVE